MSTQTLAQRRACHALRRIQEHGKAGKHFYKNYVSCAESLPATILMNGLGQACATLLAKAEGVLEKPHGLLYVDLQLWLCGPDPAAPYRNGGNLMDAITRGDQTAYLRAEAEALAYLVWLKKFARAYLERGDGE
jgi:CRISPR-associated protein Cmr5